MKIVKDQTEEAVSLGTAVLSRGGIIIMPTDTVYGMAVDPGNTEAVDRLYEIKKRKSDNPLARFFTSAEGLEIMDPILPLQVRKCAQNLLPGPLTLVLEDRTGKTTGIRIPDHPTALGITAALSFPPAVTSVNISESPPLGSISDIIETFQDKVDLIIDAGDIPGRPSTVAGFLKKGIVLLREGDISLDTVKQHSEISVLFVCSGNICRSAAAEHYLKKALREKYKADDLSQLCFRIGSAGTFMLEGNTPPQEVITLMKEEGIDISGHTSTPLYPALMENADIIYTMDSSHTEFIRGIAPQYLDKTEMLDPEGRDIPDPYQKPMEEYRKVLARIKYSVSEVEKSL